MSRRTMSKGGAKGQKGARTQAQPPPPPPTVLNNKEHNNNTKGSPQSEPHTSKSSAKQVLKDKNSPASSAVAANAVATVPSASPLPPEEELGLGEVELEEDLEEEEDEDEEDCEDEEEEEELDEDDDEYEEEDNDTEPLASEGRTHHHPADNQGSPAAYNSPLYLGSTSEEDDEDEGEGDDSGDRESDDEDEEDDLDHPEFLLSADGDPSGIQGIPSDAQARLEAFFEAAGFTDGKLMSDPENLRKLTLTVSSALGEASAAINRMRDSQRKSLEEGRNDSMEEGDSLLALACSSGYFELARVLLAMGANVDDRGSKGDLTPLMDAASQGHLEIVKLLISHGAEVNAQSACGNSPLMYAAAAGHEEIVKELLKAGARVEDNNENGHTPLMEAASSGHVGVAKILLANGAGINTSSNEFKESALTVACYKGHLEMVRYLLEAGADQQHKTDEMHTALMEASMDGHVEVAKLLLDCGAQVNMPVDSFESPLTLAACGGHVELAQLLISRGANIEEVNDEGYTPLMEAAREGHLNVVKCLIAAGAKVNAETDETHETALTLSACGGFLEVVEHLVEHGADVEAGASTALMEAAQEGHYQVVKYLIQKGANVHRETQSKDTALAYACENGHVDVAQFLVDSGSHVEHLSEGGRTPLMKACRGGHVEVIKYLLTKGAHVNRPTASNDHTPLSLACAGGHLAAVEVLIKAGGNIYHKLKDNSTMIIEAARGGHTNVIKCLLDLNDLRETQEREKLGIEKDPTQPGQSQKSSTATAQTKPSQARKGLADAQKPTATAGTSQGKSVLRKSRSTSTLDSSQKGQVSAAAVGGSGDSKPLAAKVPSSIIPAEKGGNQGLPLGDGKPTVSSSTDETRKKPKPTTSTPASKPASSEKIAGTVTGASALKLQATAASGSVQGSSQPPDNHVVVGSTPALAKTPEQTQSHVSKRAAESTTSPGSVASSSPTSTATTSPGGPPVHPAQVTAATAISERPKAKANKPSARKQIHLQQQIQQQLQQQQQQQPLPNSSATSALGTITLSGTSSVVKAPVTPPHSTSTAAQMPYLPGLHPQMLQNMHVQQIFTQHQSQSLIYKDRKFEFDAAGGTVTSTTPLAYDASDMLAADFAQVLAAYPGQQGSPTAGLPSTTTTTTTTVVVTHGNGETDTIIEGDNLPPGTNEMIMSAAAAAFPLDCYSSVPVGTAVTSGPVSQLVQSYHQLGSPLNMNVGVAGDAPTSLTTTMLTTTIINSGTHLPSPIVLPHTPHSHHPPPLPAAFSEAAAAAGLVPPTGAPPTPSSEGHKVQKQMSKAKMAQAQTQTQPPKEKVILPPPSGKQHPAATPSMKKQTAKRSRPFPSSQHSCPNNHKNCSGGHQAVGTQTSGAADKEKEKENAKPGLDINSATETSGETSLSIASAQGHFEVVQFLLDQGADLEHRDKKGCTPLILAADGGHEKICELLINEGADLEAQSERTKDTALSLACTKGRYEVVDLLVKRGANKEHRNVSDYTPLSLAASGGFVNIIKLLLQHGAEINSRTGSKLGISPLMLASMNGNTAAVKLLLDMGSDINAQIETNKNTALTLACFQGRHEVVQLLLDRKANLEHRAKTGLTPLMEAANGGYVEVGKILIEKGADVNALPVPATRDTALTIAADKGHFRFVEMLLACGASVDVRNKKGCSPLWLACNGGHLDVCQALQRANADVDAQDNRKISCLLSAFRKGHVKVVRWIVKYVKQFPADADLSRFFLALTNEPELLKRCHQCMEFIKQAKDKQAIEASKNANILLEELELERSREESKKAAAAKRREKKKKKKMEKKQQNGYDDDNDDDEDNDNDDDPIVETLDSGVDVNSVESNSSSLDKKKGQQGKGGKGNKENIQVLPAEPARSKAISPTRESEKEPEPPQQKDLSTPNNAAPPTKSQKKKKNKTSKSASSDAVVPEAPAFAEPPQKSVQDAKKSNSSGKDKDVLKEKVKEVDDGRVPKSTGKEKEKKVEEKKPQVKSEETTAKELKQGNNVPSANKKGKSSSESSQGPEPLMNISLNPPHQRKAPFEHESNLGFNHIVASSATGNSVPSQTTTATPAKSPNVPTKTPGRKDDGWKEVTRSCPSSRSKKVMVPSSVISRVIGRGGCNINAIREATNAHIEVEKQQKGQVQPERSIQIKGSADATKQAFNLITALMNEPDVDIKKLIPQHTRGAAAAASSSSNPSNGASTPTPISIPNAFPIIGSATAPLPPISSQQPSVNKDSQSVTSTSSSEGIPSKFSTSAGKKGSPTPKVSTSSSSPPLNYVKSGSGSPPMKKSSHQPANAGNFEIGNFSVSEVPAEIYSKNYGKKSMVFTNSGATSTKSTPSIDPTLTGVGNWGEIKPRNATPTNVGSEVKPNPPANVSSTASVPFMTSAPTSSPITTAVPCSSPASTSHQKLMSNPNPPSSSQPSHPHYPSKAELDGAQQQFRPSSTNSPGVPSADFTVSQPSQPPRNLAPGPPAIGSNRPGASNERPVSEAGPEMSQKSSTTDSGPQPLEYSPFNYTFSKTTGWFPGDLAVPQHQSGSVGMNNLIASLSSGGSTSSLSASRAMNFASVAASGISASMSTTTAQMSSVPGVNGPIVSAIGKPLDGVPVHPSPMSPTETHDHGRADAAKAPGYRGASSMGSPVMRLPQPPLQSVPNFPLDLGQALSGLSQMNFNSRPNYGGQYQPPADLGLLNSQQPVNGGSQMMFQQQNNSSGGTPVPLPPPPVQLPPPQPNPPVPTNVVLSSRLNPRAPSFMAKVPGQSSTQYSTNNASAFASNPQSQQPFMPQPFKGNVGQQFGSQGQMQPQPAPSRRQLGSNWGAYSNGSLEDIAGFQALSNLAGPTGMIDPGTLLGGLESLNDNFDDRRLPRPIGGERSWKGSTGGASGGASNLGGGANIFPGMEGIEPAPANWLGMYGSSNQTGFPSGNNQGLPPPRSDNRGGSIMGRRFMEDLGMTEASRLMDLQQGYESQQQQQRLLNGGNAPPMMHMQNAMPHPNQPAMFPFGMEQIDQHGVPKLDQQWDSHGLLMDEKHLQQGWGGKWGN